MIKEIFEEFAATKNSIITESKVDWDGIVETFVRDEVTLKYRINNWSVEIKGMHLVADLRKPSSLPFKEMIDSISISVDAKFPLTKEHSSFTISKNIGLLRSKKYRVNTKNDNLKIKLEDLATIQNYFNIPHCPETRIIGKESKDYYSLRAIIFADKNQKELALALIKASEEIMTILENR